jgi:hypothetical protein
MRMKNNNRRPDLILRSYVRNDKQSFINELRSKGYKMTGREGVEKIINMLLNHKKKSNEKD